MIETYKVSAVLCHHKGFLIEKAVESLKKSKHIELEIIVVTSDEDCMKRLENSGCVMVFERGGPAHKRNVGVKFAQNDNIAFFDDDIEVRPYAVYEMAKWLKEPEVGMVFGKLLNMEFHNKFDEAGSFLTWSGFLWARAESGCEDVGQFNNVECVLAGKSAACMISKKVFGRVGMFDQSYEILGEETDLAWRVWLYGYYVLYVPSSVTYHAFNTKFKKADMYTPNRVYFNGSRNYISMLMTYRGNRDLIIPVIVQFIVWFMAGCGFIITGKREAGFNVFRGLRWVLTHLDCILSKRGTVQKNRKISDKELMSIVRRNPPFMYYVKRFLSYVKTGRHG